MKLTRVILISLFFSTCFFHARTQASEQDSIVPLAQMDTAKIIVTDSTKIITADTTFVKKHSPHKASIYSAILPGLGQAYNKKYWKIPLIYAGLGGLGYAIVWNNKRYQQNRKAYIDLTDGDDTTNSYEKLEWTRIYDLKNPSSFNNLKDGLIKRQDYYRRNRDFNIIITAVFYALNIIDASVDAHFFNFDISDDLSMNWQPSFVKNEDLNYYAFSCTINF